MYIKIYIFGNWNGNELENVFLISNFTKSNDFWQKWLKITFLVKKILGQSTKYNIKLKMLKLLENHVKTKVYEGFSQFFD